MKVKGFAIGLAVGVIVTLAITAPWRAIAEERWYKVPGDVNGDGGMNIADAIFILNYIFAMGPAPVSCEPCSACPGCDSCCPKCPDCPACDSCCPPRMYLPTTGQEECYDEWGSVIDCANAECPGQDGFYRAGCSRKERFVDNEDGTVTDTCTGLMWQKDTPREIFTWAEALRHCEGLTLAGHSDWRLPNMLEIQTIIDYGRSMPAINPILGAEKEWYWSSTSLNISPGCGWLVGFWGGYDGFKGINGKGTTAWVRAVRGGL